MKKKVISLLCILALLIINTISLCAADIKNSESEYKDDTKACEIMSDNVIHVNPIYADVVTEDDLKKDISSIEKKYIENTSKSKSINYVSDINVLSDQLREKMVKRTEIVELYYKTSNYSSEEGKKLIKNIIDMALMNTEMSKEGDYIAFQYKGYDGSLGGYAEGDNYFITFKYVISYYTTAEQEAEMDTEIDNLVYDLGLDTDISDYEKICVIYDYICKNIKYDYENLKDDNYKLKYTAYAALINKTAVCQGYANLFFRLAKEAGVDTRIISGDSITNATGVAEPHGWNIVELDGKYYYLDATWDAERTPYDYFLKGSADFDDADSRYTHVPNEEYLTDEFLKRYPVSENAYVEKEYATINIETAMGSELVDLDGNKLTDTFICEVGRTLEFTISVDDNYRLIYYCYGFEGENEENNFGGSDIPWDSENENYYFNVEYAGTYTISTFTEKEEKWEQNLLRVVGHSAGTRYFGSDEVPAEDVIYQFMKMNLDEYLNDEWYFELSYDQYMDEVKKYFVNYVEMKDFLLSRDVYDETADKILIYSGGYGGGTDWILTSTYETKDGNYVLQGIYLNEEYPQGLKFDDSMNIVHPVELTLTSTSEEEWKIISYEMGSYYLSETIPEQGINLYTYNKEGNYDGGIYHTIKIDDTKYSKISITDGGYTFKNNDNIWYKSSEGFKWKVDSEKGYVSDVKLDYYNQNTQEREEKSIGISGHIKQDCAVILTVDEAVVFEVEADHAKVKILQGMNKLEDGSYAYKSGSAVELQVTVDKDYIISKVTVGNSKATYISATGTYNAYPSYKPGKIVVETKKYCDVKGHKYDSDWTIDKRATVSENGSKSKHCTRNGCSAKSSVTTIYKASGVKLSTTSYVYNGNMRSPSVVIKDSKENTISSSNYTLTKPSGRKNAGKYVYTINFRNEYSGTKNLTLTIKPKKITSLSLSTVSYTYDGKIKKPTVTVKADTLSVASKRITDSSNVDITYASGRKNVGSYKVTVKGIGNYTGTLTKSFKINPKKTSLKSLTKGKKSFTVKWNKVTSQITGYEIRYSRNSSMSNAKTIKIKSYKTTSTTVKKLSAKKKYYVQVRVYKTTGGNTYYSAWSSKNSVTTK